METGCCTVNSGEQHVFMTCLRGILSSFSYFMIIFYYFVFFCFLYTTKFTLIFYDKFGGREFTNRIKNDFLSPVDEVIQQTIKLSIHNVSQFRIIRFSFRF